MDGPSIEGDECTQETLNCDPFDLEGYLALGTCNTVENSEPCSASCDTENEFFSTGDGLELTMEFICQCDRTAVVLNASGF